MSFGTISEKPGGGCDHTSSGTEGDACCQEHFMQVEMAWQVSR